MMIDQAIGHQISRGPSGAAGGALASAGRFLLLLLPGVLASILSVTFAVALVAGNSWSIDAAPVALATLFLAVAGVYLIRLWLRARR